MKTSYPEDDIEFLKRLDAIITDNLSREDLSVAFLADRMCMSLSTFFRRVKDSTGMGGNEYIRSRRIGEVLFKLQNASRGGYLLTISDAAFACGFASLSAFDKAFRKKYGVTPSEYIEKYLSPYKPN